MPFACPAFLHSSCASDEARVATDSHINMELFSSHHDLFFPYSSVVRTSTDMAESVALKESIEVATSSVHNGTIAGSSESPARGISGANPKRLVNGEAVSALVVSEADMQRLSNQTVLKKALSVSEAELLQSAIAEEEKLAVDGTSVAVNDLDAQLEKSKSQATDNQVQVSQQERL